MRWNVPIVMSAALLVAASASVAGSAGRDQFAGGRRHDDDAYIKAALDERENLLNTALKSICRGR
jgi:hypothetical protein